MLRRSGLVAAVLLTSAFAACETKREDAVVVPYLGSVEALLEAQCARCHAGSAPAAGWRVDSYLGAIGCTSEGKPAVGDAKAPILSVLDRPDHAALLSADERGLLVRWVAGGSSRGGAGIHGASFADPRSPSSHGFFLRAKGYAPMLDPNDRDACGTCHDGAARRSGITSPAALAPACTTCHAEPGGALGCGTCHGDGQRSYPPRNPCFFPADSADRAHAVHLGANASRSAGIACSTCHPVPTSGEPNTVHANGAVELQFDRGVAGREAAFDAPSKRCSGTCHARGGTRPTPAWGDASMTCNDCHSSPPAKHYLGACTSCHREADATGAHLANPTLHLNGKVDLGDGSGKCGACHGQGDDPWPTTGAHQAHRKPASSRPVLCETCHSVPAAGTLHPVGAGAATVRLRALATHGGRQATYDPASKTCAGTYCHEGAGATSSAPRWTDGPSEKTCTSCHSAPPPPPHAQSATCSGSGCHEGSTSAGAITEAGRAAHVDGLITRGLP